MTRTIHYCNFCDYKSDRRYDRDKHVSRKHGIHLSSPSNKHHPSIAQLYGNINHWQKAYNSLKDQYDNLYIVGKHWEEACKQREEIIRQWIKVYPELEGYIKKENN